MASLYLLYSKSDPDNIRYVGITKYEDISKRMRMHADRLKSGNTLPLYRWMRKHKDVEVFIVASGITWEEACEREIGIIKVFRDLHYNLLNCTSGGEGIQNISEESRNKLKESARGRKHTEEAKQKMSAAKKGKTTWNKGVPMKQETKEKLSKAKLGKNLSQEHRDKISKSLKGRRQSDHAKEAIGNAHRGKIVSEETRKKLSEAAKGKPAWNKGLKKSEYSTRKSQ